MKAIIKYILLTAVRDWLFIGLFAAILTSIGLSLFLGSVALSEQGPTQLSFLAGTTRLVLVTGMIIFICFHTRRSFENKEIDFIISRPISRTRFLLSYFISIVILSILLIIPIVIVINLLFNPNFIGSLIWSLSLFFELIIVSSFALLASLMLRTAVSAVLGCFAFYLVSRIMGFAISSIIIPAKLNNVSMNQALEITLKALSSLLPRLDQFAQSKWLIYGEASFQNISFFIIQTVIYISLLIFISIFDFNRKEF
jgi:ABC-type transport system involved in multi-copper enzyme maturation permease subunit